MTDSLPTLFAPHVKFFPPRRDRQGYMDGNGWLVCEGCGKRKAIDIEPDAELTIHEERAAHWREFAWKHLHCRKPTGDTA